MSNPSANLPQLREFLNDHLLSSVLPFWMNNAIDPAGGINTCIRDNGEIVSRDKWLWSQWRAVWVFSKLYNNVEKRQEWLDVAVGICEFLLKFGWDEKAGGWVLRLSGDGEIQAGCDSIYTDGFAMYALAELAQATGRDDLVAWACKTADSTIARLDCPHDKIPHFPYPIPEGAKVHGIPMIFSLIFWELGEFLDQQKYRDVSAAMSNDIFTNFYRADRGLIVERITDKNEEFPPPLGTLVWPGHVLEDMWFQIHIARDRGDKARIEQSIQIIRHNIEIGWDNEYGGILLGVDADGREEVGLDFADTKIWWPHTEALYALLLAYEHTSEQWCLDWYDKVHEYAFSHYPVAEHGEWKQKLDRKGQPITDIVALPVKDPFHLARSLFYCVQCLDRIAMR